jgi:lysine 6-dehydrogenase
MQEFDQAGKYIYAVLGAGRQGTAAAFDMAKFGGAQKVLLGDIDRKVAKQAAKRVNVLVGREVAQGAFVDVRRPADVRHFLTGTNAFLSSVPYYYNLNLAKAAIRARANMCDLGGNTDIVKKELLLDRDAANAGISVVPDCGMGPGMTTSLACYAMSLVDEPEEVYIYDGGLPQNPRPPFNYLLTFHFDGLANEYYGMTEFLREGEIVHVPCFEELEFVDFPPPLGRLEAFTTAGGTSTCPSTFKGKLRILQNKTLRYPGNYVQLRTMHDLGLFSDKEIRLDGNKITPRRVLQALLEPKIRLPGEKDIAIIRVRCLGKKNQHTAEATVDLVDHYDDATGFTAMERTTGWHASIVSIMMAKGETPRGAKPLELAVPGQAFVRELKRRGMTVTENVSVS